jgi:hypothetical protein
MDNLKVKIIQANRRKDLVRRDEARAKWSNTMHLPSKVMLRASFVTTQPTQPMPDVKRLTSQFKSLFAKMTAMKIWCGVLASKKHTAPVATAFRSLPGGLMVGTDFKPGMLNRRPVVVGLRVVQAKPRSLVLDLVLHMETDRSIKHKRKENLNVLAGVIKQTIEMTPLRFTPEHPDLAGLLPSGAWKAKYMLAAKPKKAHAKTTHMCKLVKHQRKSDLHNMWLVMTFDLSNNTHNTNNTIDETSLVASLAQHAKQTKQTKCMHCGTEFDVEQAEDVQDCYYVNKLNIVEQFANKVVVTADLVAPMVGLGTLNTSGSAWLDNILFLLTRQLKAVVPGLVKIQLASQIAHSITPNVAGFFNKLANWFSKSGVYVISFYLLPGEIKNYDVTRHITNMLGEFNQYVRSIRHSVQMPPSKPRLPDLHGNYKYYPVIRIINCLLVGLDRLDLERLQQRLDKALLGKHIEKFVIHMV